MVQGGPEIRMGHARRDDVHQAEGRFVGRIACPSTESPNACSVAMVLLRGNFVKRPALLRVSAPETASARVVYPNTF